MNNLCGVCRKERRKTAILCRLQKANAMTVRDTYPFLWMEECIDLQGNATIFSTTDVDRGHCQTEMTKADHDRTISSSHHGLIQSFLMPFGLKSVPTSFQRAVDTVLSRVKCQSALVYLENRIVYSKSVAKYLVHLRTASATLKRQGSTESAKVLFLSQCGLIFETDGPTGKTGCGQRELRGDPQVLARDEPRGTAVLIRNAHRVPPLCL